MTDSARTAFRTSVEPLGLILGAAEDHMMIKDIFWNKIDMVYSDHVKPHSQRPGGNKKSTKEDRSDVIIG